MDPRLTQIVTQLRTAPRRNPPISTGLALQAAIVEAGYKHAFSEDDLLEAAAKLGLDDDAAATFLEELASWL